MLLIRVRTALLAMGLVLVMCQSFRFANADQVNLDGDSPITMGGFECSLCRGQVIRSIGILDQNTSGEVYAGELWQFFHEQGVVSLNRLTLCLDIQQLDGDSSFDLQSVELSIEDPAGEKPFLTHVTLGNDYLVVPAYGTSSFKPEAKLEIALGYDFMEIFSASSREKIKLDFSSNSDQANNAKFYIEADSNFFSRSNVLLLVGFILFWVIVFIVLNRITKPLTHDSAESSAPPSPLENSEPKPSKRALSA